MQRFWGGCGAGGTGFCTLTRLVKGQALLHFIWYVAEIKYNNVIQQESTFITET